MCFFEYVISNTQKKKNKREPRRRKSEKTENRWERESIKALDKDIALV